jgi:4,5-DOPA dioxygenase extradiol
MGLDIIAICDHNSARNASATVRAAINTDLTVIPGMEITSSEEVHILGLFPSDREAEAVQDEVYGRLVGQNQEKVFGYQVVVNEDDEVEDLDQRLLIGATTLNCERVVSLIHDFGGFPQELFDQQYPAPGDPDAASAISLLVRQRASAPLGLDTGDWGLDHGAWSVLKPMFPNADIPVIQLSMDYGRAPEDHYALAKQLKTLRDRGVLIVASGNVVHNLRQMQRGTGGNQAYDWALEFDQTIGGQVQQGNLGALQNFQKLGSLAKMAHPSHEHYLPLLYAAGAVDAREPMQFLNTSFQGGSISMRSMVWG